MAPLAPLLDLVVEEAGGGALAGSALHLAAVALFALLGIGCVVLTLIGLPGLWLLLLLAGALQWSDRFVGDGSAATFSAWTLGGAVALAVLAEVAEFFAGASGARKAGASKRGAIGAMVGGIIGAIVGTPFAPIVGTIIGGVIGSALGAIAMELTLPHQTLQGSLEPAHGAVMGRLKGMALKLVITVALWIGLTVAALVG